jgi:hypothetical protein
MMRTLSVLGFAAATLIAVSTTTAQDVPSPTARQAEQQVDRFQRQLDEFRSATRIRVNPDIPPGTRVFYDYGIFIGANYLSLDDANLDNRGLRQFDFTGFARVNLDGVHEVFFRGRTFYRDFNPGDEFEVGEGDGWDGRIDRLYYRFDLARHFAAQSGQDPTYGAAIKLGRDLVYWGTGLTLAQDLDGVVIDLSTGNHALQLIAGRTPSDTVDIDSSRRDFDDHTNRAFYGALAATRISVHRPYAYVLVQRDHNPNGFSTSIGGTPINTDYDYNSWYIGVGSTGALSDRLAYGVELVYEGGDTLSSPFILNPDGTITSVTQTRDDISALAFNAQLDYLVGDRRNTRISGEVIYASGDSDRINSTNTFAGNRTGTRDRGFNAFGLLNTGVAFSPSVSNLVSFRGGVSTFPCPDSRWFRRLQVGADAFVFFKANKRGGIDEPSESDDRYLGFEPNVYVNWQITSDLSLAVRYGVFFPGDAVSSDDEIRQFFFAGLTFSF